MFDFNFLLQIKLLSFIIPQIICALDPQQESLLRCTISNLTLALINELFSCCIFLKVLNQIKQLGMTIA